MGRYYEAADRRQQTTSETIWRPLRDSVCVCVSGDLAYEVRWFFTRLRGGQTSLVGSVDRLGVVRKEARNSSSDISIERKNTHTYVLNIHATQDR